MIRVAPFLPAPAVPRAPDPLTDPLSTGNLAEPLMYDELVAARMARSCVPRPHGDFDRQAS